jgi:hypothetical protein
VNNADFLGLKTITFRVAGDRSGVLLDVFNLAGMDGLTDTVKDVLRKCPCHEPVGVEFEWDWTL